MSQAPRCLRSNAGQSKSPLSRGRALSLVRFVCGLPPFGTAAMFLASPLVRPYGQVSKRSAAGASRSLLECLGPLGIIHISAPAHRRVLDRGHRRDSACPHPLCEQNPRAGSVLILPDAFCLVAAYLAGKVESPLSSILLSLYATMMEETGFG